MNSSSVHTKCSAIVYSSNALDSRSSQLVVSKTKHRHDERKDETKETGPRDNSKVTSTQYINAQGGQSETDETPPTRITQSRDPTVQCSSFGKLGCFCEAGAGSLRWGRAWGWMVLVPLVRPGKALAGLLLCDMGTSSALTARSALGGRDVLPVHKMQVERWNCPITPCPATRP